jgi:PmbA protein
MKWSQLELNGIWLPRSFFNRAVHTTRVSYKANKLHSIGVEEVETRAARALARSRLGHASSTDHEATERQLVARAIAASQHGRLTRMAFPSSRVRSRPADGKLARLTAQDLALIGDEIVSIIRQAAPDASVELQVQRSREEVRLRNSAGGRVEATSGAMAVEAWVERHRDQVLVVFDSHKTAQVESHREFAARIAQRLTWADKPVYVQPGRMPVILSPTAAATLLQPLVLALSGSLARGKSGPLAGKVGQPLFDPRLTIVDDGTLADRPGGPFDHEGTLTQRTTLVRNGMVTGFYYDLKTAAQAGVPSTGNGRRDLLAPPRPQPNNIVIEPGTTSLEAMLRQAGDGLLVDLLLGASPAHALRGTFSRTVLLGYKIERGQIAGYVKGVALAGNLYEMLRELKAIGDMGYWSGDICSPYLLVEGLCVTV